MRCAANTFTMLQHGRAKGRLLDKFKLQMIYTLHTFPEPAGPITKTAAPEAIFGMSKGQDDLFN